MVSIFEHKALHENEYLCVWLAYMHDDLDGMCIGWVFEDWFWLRVGFGIIGSVRVCWKFVIFGEL